MVALVAVVAIVLVTRDSGTPDALPPTSTSASPTSTTRTTTPRPSTGPKTPAPQIAGYQVVVPENVGAAWDIPADWNIDQDTKTFGTGADQLPIAGLSQEGSDYCPNYVRTNMFLSVAQKSDPTEAAIDVGARMARIGWDTATSMTASPAEPFTSSDKAVTGVFVETKGAFTPPDPTCASTYSIYTFAIPAGADSGALVLTIAADTNVDRAVDNAFARRLLATFRLI